MGHNQQECGEWDVRVAPKGETAQESTAFVFTIYIYIGR